MVCWGFVSGGGWRPRVAGGRNYPFSLPLSPPRSPLPSVIRHRLTPLFHPYPHPCRSPAHCIEYAKLILWSQARPGEEFDTDNEEHMKWVYERAVERAKQYGIQVRAGVCVRVAWWGGGRDQKL